MQGAISFRLTFQTRETATWNLLRKRRWDHLSHVSRIGRDPGQEKENTWCVTRNKNREKSDLASRSITSTRKSQVKGHETLAYMNEHLGASICYLDGHNDIVVLLPIQCYSRGTCLLAPALEYSTHM